MFKHSGVSVSGALFFLCAASAGAQYSDTLKVMTYNINAESHGSGSYADIAEVINAVNPDINGLQKLDSCNSRNSNYVLQYLGGQTGMDYTFAAAVENYGGGTGSYGIGFLSDSSALSSRRLQISGSSEDRAALEIGITMNGEAVRVIVTHLDPSSASTRASELKAITAWLDSAGDAGIPAVIMADFNAKSTESSMNVLTGEGFVFVKDDAGDVLDTAQKINHILYRPESRWSVLRTGNPAYSASNRYPLWATLRLLPSSTAHGTAEPRRISGIRVTGRSVEISLSLASEVTITLYGTNGKILASPVSSEKLSAGEHSFVLPGSVHGIAILKMKVGGKPALQKVITAL